MSHWIHRPLGRLAGLLLLVAMVLAGAPNGKLHVHIDADHGHDHSSQAAVHHLSGHDEAPGPTDPATTVLHAHDIGTSVPAVLDLPGLTFRTPLPMSPSVASSAPPPPSTSRIPPHRPPIV